MSGSKIRGTDEDEIGPCPRRQRRGALHVVPSSSALSLKPTDANPARVRASGLFAKIDPAHANKRHIAGH
jgi:hypothetical protein